MSSVCRRCGACCNQHCPHFSWQAVKDIKSGEQFMAGSDHGHIVGVCAVYHSDETILIAYPESDGRSGDWLCCPVEQRRDYPYSDAIRPVGCSIRQGH